VFLLGVAVGVGVATVVSLLLSTIGDDQPSGDRAVAAAALRSTTTGHTTTSDRRTVGSTRPASLDVDGETTSSGAKADGEPAPVGSNSDESDVTPVSCPPTTNTVDSAEALRSALRGAGPGDVIHLADGTYSGSFVASTSGTADRPIVLCGGRGAVLDGGGTKKGYVFHLDHVSHWQLLGFTVRNGQKGVMADGTTSSTIRGLLVEEIGDEAIHLRAASSSNSVLGNTVRRTGLRKPKFGEGIYVGSARSNWATYSGGGPDTSDGNVIRDNDVSQTTSESIDIKEGTTGGSIVGNHFDGTGMTAADSLIDVKGNDWTIEGNTGIHGPADGFQTHQILDGWGSRNVFRGNTIGLDGDGRHIYIHDPDQTHNTVACDNRPSDGGQFRSNVACT
jgi:nitrous oxidase accessory protein NosD